MDVISCRIKQSIGSFKFRLHKTKKNLKLTLFEVFRIGTSFSALILASISSQTSALFWKRTLEDHREKQSVYLKTHHIHLPEATSLYLLHLLSQLLCVLPDGLGQLGHRVQHQVIQDHLEE